MNWRGRPLVDHETVVKLIGATTTKTGLTVQAERDEGSYPKGIVVPDKELQALNETGRLTPHETFGSWNVTIRKSRLDIDV